MALAADHGKVINVCFAYWLNFHWYDMVNRLTVWCELSNGLTVAT
jgi:hypothetical protein